jgi:hypothetical protein
MKSQPSGNKRQNVGAGVVTIVTRALVAAGVPQSSVGVRETWWKRVFELNG